MTSTENTVFLKLSKTTAYPVIERYFSSGELPSTFYRREGLTEHQFYKSRKYYIQNHPSLAARLGLDESARRSRKWSGKAKGRKSAKPAAPSKEDTGFGRIVSADTAGHVRQAIDRFGSMGDRVSQRRASAHRVRDCLGDRSRADLYSRTIA